MKKHNSLVLSPRCAQHYSHGEAAAHGEADVAVNLRQQEDSAVVTGRPSRCASIGAGHKLLLVDEPHYFTLHAGIIYCDGSAVARVDSDVVGMHRVGSMLVVVTVTGLVHLCYDGDACVVVDQRDAMPSLTITAADTEVTRHSLEACDFDTPYGTWPALLSDADLSRLTSRLRNAWNTAVTAARSRGSYAVPVMACYGVRLWDDNYLCFSDAVTVGMNTLDNSQAITALVVSSQQGYTGIEGTTMSMSSYRLGITVNGPMGARWQGLVKSIDVFVTDCPAIADTTSLYYRCLTMQSGTRRATLQYGWQPLSSDLVVAALESSGWNLVASTSDMSALRAGHFVAGNVVQGQSCDIVVAPAAGGIALTRRHVQDAGRNNAGMGAVASMVRNGRLYMASADGRLACSAHGNAMVITHAHIVTGARVTAIAPVSRPIYSGGFGRYAVYVFTDEGIYAVAQSALGVMGEARLVDRSVAASGCRPVDGGGEVYYTDRYGWLCRLAGSCVERLLPCPEAVKELSWDDCHRELHVLSVDGGMLAVTRKGAYSRRTVSAVSLYDDVLHSLAVTREGDVLDLSVEEDAEQTVHYLSHPVVLNRHRVAVPCRVQWNIDSDCAALSLTLLGENGVSCRGCVMGGLRVDGAIKAPLAIGLVAPPCRTVRVEVKGSAFAGTVLGAVLIEHKNT